MLEKESGVPISKLAPAVGEFVLHHKSPSHLKDPELFEAFDPELLGMERKIDQP
jgi:isopropylmalate/homocitrate/citramalate synthase